MKDVRFFFFFCRLKLKFNKIVNIGTAEDQLCHYIRHDS